MPTPANSLNITQQGTVYFDGVSIFTGIDGDTAGYVLTSNGTGVEPSFQPASGSSSITINGDTGSISGSTLTIFAGQVGNNSGATVRFDNSGTTSQLSVTDSVGNTLVGLLAGSLTRSGISNTGLGRAALSLLTTGSFNTCIGSGALGNCLGGSGNTSSGYLSLGDLNTGNNNTADGYQCLRAVNTGSDNTCVGFNNLLALTSGNYNCTLGSSVAVNLLTGEENTLLGYATGNNYTGAETANILIGTGTVGVAGEDRVTRIGNAGAGGATPQVACYIDGINGVTVTGTAVLCATDGQLGTISSSARYKENIVDMPENVSIMKLRPVQFNYKNYDETSYGLVAEEVDKDFPYLCFYKNGQPESVKYHELCVFLLAEIKRLEARVTKLEAM